VPYRRIRPSLALASATALLATGPVVALLAAQSSPQVDRTATTIAAPGPTPAPKSGDDMVISLHRITGLDMPDLRLPYLIHHPIGTPDTPGTPVDRARSGGKTAPPQQLRRTPWGPQIDPKPESMRPIDADDTSAIGRAWQAAGGPDGALGAALSNVISLADGASYARFADGDLFNLANGDVVTVTGRILEKFVELGAAAGKLGLPLADQYAVPGGMRQDFQNGSVIIDEATGVATTVLKTFTETYTRSYNHPDN
jgi:hypothetical protein